MNPNKRLLKPNFRALHVWVRAASARFRYIRSRSNTTNLLCIRKEILFYFRIFRLFF